ncbi:MAG: hypothetical protein KAH18_13255 [Psychromonas sp.]|nr:hypothetical protein [Psychromonas sp.]
MKNVNLFLLRFLLILSSALMLIACSSSMISREPVKIVLTAVGYAPIASQKGKTFNHKMLNAIKSSKIEAYKELAEQIHGVKIIAENTMVDAHIQNDNISSNITSGLIRGATVTKSYHRGAFYITELELNMTTLPPINKLNTNVKAKRHSVIKIASSQTYY